MGSLLAAVLAAVLLISPVAAAHAAPHGAARKHAHWVERLHAGEALHAPAGQRPARIDRGGVSILPNGRLLDPAGPTVEVAPHPFGLVLSPDNQTVVTVNSGTKPFSISLVQAAGRRPTVRQIPPGNDNDRGVIDAVFMGIAYAPDGRTLYVSGGNDGTILVLDPATGAVLRTIDLNVPFGGRAWRDGYIGDLRLSPDGTTLYALDQANFRLVRVDVATGAVTAVLPTGRYPFGLALSPDGTHAYVANVGMFAYSFVDGFDPAHPETTALPFPAFGAGTTAARVGTTTRRGIHVPGLGDPNDERSFSLWTFDLRTGAHIGSLKTGPRVGHKVAGIPAVGGSSPNSVVTDGRRVYVSNNASDTVAVTRAGGRRLLATIPLAPTRELRHLRGNMPFGLALSPRGDRLYVAESGINAVAVIDTRRRRVLGHIPVGWYPSKLAVSADGRRLYVANAKGFGSGPNAGPGYDAVRGDPYVGSLMHGSVTRVQLPAPRSKGERTWLRRWTGQVLTFNGFKRDSGHRDGKRRQPHRARHHRTKAASIAALENGRSHTARRHRKRIPRPPARRARSPIRHVIFVTKENRTFDQVLGDLGTLGGRRVRGDPAVANAPATGYGEHTTVLYGDETTAAGVNVTPNHHALAREFATSDNAYVDSDVSADGHRWLVGVAPDEFDETSVAASYGGRQDFRIDQTPEAALGRRGFFGSNAALAPEDYPEAGSIWDGFARAGTTFRNYGEGLEQAGIREGPGLEPTGARLSLNIPIPRPLFANTDRRYPSFNINISDQYRYEEFAREFSTRYLGGKRTLPQFVNVHLPADHTAGPRPDRGYPSTASYVADNDYALGRLVELVSHSKYWHSTAILVTEDDAQSGLDTVDAHRTVLLVISPWAKRRYLSREHTSIASITKTINLLTGTPYLNQFDAAATSLLGSFTDKPDFTPYVARPPDGRIFQPASPAATRARPGVPGPPGPELDDRESTHDALLVAIAAGRKIKAGKRP